MGKKKGWIALDIDGTITDSSHHVPSEVTTFLHSVQKMGWKFIFLTGRTYSFASPVIKKFDFPFYLAVQNGADILSLPDQQLIRRCYLDSAVIPILEQAYLNEKEDFIVYSGYEKGDFCYYRPQNFSPILKTHLDKIMALSPEAWKAVESFDFEHKSAFPLVKCLGKKQAMRRMNNWLQAFPKISPTWIRDPLTEGVHLILVTAKKATKGNALQWIKQLEGKDDVVIAAGDDFNDLSMLQAADVKIVMASAPSTMHRMATIVAKPSQEQGIIAALTEAIQSL